MKFPGLARTKPFARACSVLVALAGFRDPVSAQRPASQPAVPFTVADKPWDSETLGNHRAVVRVIVGGPVARVMLPWRRRDRNPEAKAILVVDERTGGRVTNVRRGIITQSAGEIDFEPVAGPGRYFIYYLPYQSGLRSNYPHVTYLPVQQTLQAGWLNQIAAISSPPLARVERFEAIDSLNSFDPMEVIATPEERGRLAAAHPGEPFLVFPEDRLHSIRMRDQLPLRWIAAGPRPSFEGEARRGEFFAWQLGVYALRDLDQLTVTFTDLKSRSGATIPAGRQSSINNGGIDWDGKRFTKLVDVDSGRIQAMWCGADIPLDAVPDTYVGEALVSAAGLAPKRIAITLRVTHEVASDGGAAEPWKQTRLKWLNSTLGQRNDVIPPYPALVVSGNSVRLLGRRLTLAPNGLPARIETFFTPEMTGYSKTATQVLAAPIRFELWAGKPPPAGAASGVRFTRRDPGTVAWTAVSSGRGWALAVRGALEFDGYLSYTMVLRAEHRLTLDDIRLAMPFAPGAATYMMGLGEKGRRRPARLEWTWDVAKKNQDGAWIGGVNAGLSFSLRGENYVRPLNTNFYLQKPLNLPAPWGNGGRGGITIAEAADRVDVTARTGPRTLAPGDSLVFNASFLITPFHPIDTDYQWTHRFYHRYASLDSIAELGANVVNIHHATPINPYINYPFIAHEEMKAYVDQAHRKHLSVKIYNTVRELSNRAYETFALRSLGHEIYAPGKGGGYSWLQEHLGDDYIAAWFVPELKDAAIVSSGMSRWHNYYVEGINWLVKNVGIDGLYLDDVAFDRTTMKRVKRMLVQDGRPGIIDLHSANQFNERDGFSNSAVLYLEHFPYLNRLWFGEYFDYEKNSADFLLTEVSGIPFGLMGEMLEGGGNPWRGLLYGMTNRMPWTDNADPRPIWKLWDEFGITGSKMLGYWAASTPVRTDRADVLATAYVKPDRVLIALASWAPENVAVKLVIDWRALGLDRNRVILRAPEMRGLQAARTVAVDAEIPVAPGKGSVLILERRPGG
ncbi:MAG: glycoside hydrolase domain-containing protein [Gemmatimonadota bacterium]